ncbi:MAG: type II secretion system protein [Candidatus Vogelbacteria bacterium]
MKLMKLQANEATHGFTLIEIMVSVTIFTVVAMITTGALITISDVNRKAQAIKIAMDNVSFAMDSMVTNLREGINYGCGDTGAGGTPCTVNQPIVFESTRIGSGDFIGYRLKAGSIQSASNNVSIPIDGQYTDITSSEVNITKLSFYIPSLQPQETPRVTLVVEGQVPGKTITNFYLQTTVKKI